MDVRGILLAIGLFIAVPAALTYHGIVNDRAEQQRLEQEERSLHDLSVPPVISKRMADPDWTIAHWLGVGQKTEDCATAEEYMDRGVNSDVVSRRAGSSKIYYLKDYIESCKSRPGETLAFVERSVEPRARKWCAYRQNSPRFETLCREWEQNKSRYIAEIRGSSEPTLARYRAFVSPNYLAGLPYSDAVPPPTPCAENGSCYGDISALTGHPKTVHVDGYYRNDGTYVRGHYRGKPD